MQFFKRNIQIFEKVETYKIQGSVESSLKKEKIGSNALVKLFQFLSFGSSCLRALFKSRITWRSIISLFFFPSIIDRFFLFFSLSSFLFNDVSFLLSFFPLSPNLHGEKRRIVFVNQPPYPHVNEKNRGTMGMNRNIEAFLSLLFFFLSLLSSPVS